MAYDASKVLSFKCGNLAIENISEIRDFAKELVNETEEIISKVIPAKIFALDKLHKSDMFNKKSLSEIDCDINISKRGLANHNNSSDNSDVMVDGELKNPGKKRKYESDTELSWQSTVAVNNGLTPLIEALKPEIKSLIHTCSRVQLWIQLLIPKIEDGNNFGVSIQADNEAQWPASNSMNEAETGTEEEILNEVTRIQTEATGYLDQISRYYITRGKLLSKVAKYPFLDDYRQVIKEVDEKEYSSLQLNCCELRNFYLLLLDSISKNFEKIKKPRSSNAESMY